MLPRLLDSNMRETKRLNALDASITERIIPLSTATVILPDTETLPLRSWVQMFNGYGESAIYRVNTPGLNIDNCISEYQLDHGVCEIGDYIINSDAEYSGAANTVISQIFSNYRGSLWQLGTVAATDQVEVNSDHGDVLSALLDAVEQLHDYTITLDQSTTPWTFAVVAKTSAIGGEGRLSRNIASLDISEDTSTLCTRLYGDALTGGHMDADTISLYGVVEQYAGKGEGTTQEKYLADCQKYLNQHKHPLRVIKIDLLDLHAVTGEPLDKAELGKLYRLALPKYNIIESQRVYAREWPSLYGDTERIIVTLGNEAMDMNALFDSCSATSASNSSKEKRKSEAQNAKWRFTDKHVTDQGEILHAAGLEIDAHGVWLYASEDGPNYALGSSFKVQSDAITAEVTRATEAEGQLGSRITETATEIRSDVYAANSQIYSTIQQTASSITSVIEDTEQGLYSYIQQTASGIRQTFNATSNRTIVNDTDPRGATYTPKDGDIWIESVHDGTWDGADGFDWEHDEDYDWTQVQGAKVWTWKNNQWQLVADRQQLVTYSDFVNTADTLISQKIVELANEEGQIEVYRSLIEQTGEQIRSEVYSATSEIYSYIHQTASSIIISVDNHAQKTYVSDAVKDGPPGIIIGEDGIARDANGRPFLDGDTWINTADQDTWDKALEWNWEDDADYNWSDLRDDEIQRYDADSKAWVPVVNGRVFTDPLEMEIADDRITANMRSIDVVNGKVEENAHQLSVTTQELRSTFNDRITGVSSELLQTKTDLTSAIGDITRVDGKITTIEGSALWQQRNSITGVVGKMEVDSSGNLVIKDGAGMRFRYIDSGGVTRTATFGTYVNNQLDAGVMVEKITGNSGSESSTVKMGTYVNGLLDAGIMVNKINNDTTATILGDRVNVRARDLATWGVYTDGTLTAGIIVDKINDGSVTIRASKIDLSGYVTATQLDTTNAAINNLVSGETSASKLVASNGNFSNLEITNELKYGGYGDLKSKIIKSLSSSASGGEITISSTCLDDTAGPSVNFNIADTQYYKDGVSAARPHSLSTITLSSSDIGESTQDVTVFCNDDEEIDLTTTVDASAVYRAGRNSVTLGSLSITSNGTYNAPTYGYTGFSYVYVNVPTSSVQFGSVRSRSVAAVGANVYVNYSLDGGNTWRSYTATVQEYTG